MAINITVTTPSQPQVIEFALPGAQGPPGGPGPIGPNGPASTLTIGTVSSGATAAASLTGVAPSQILNLTIPNGVPGTPGQPATMTMGTVTTLNAGDNVTATLSGTAPDYVLNLGIPRGPAGASTGSVTVANITDASTIGRSLLQSGDAAAARSIIGAGTSSLALGTTSTTAKAGDYTPPADASASVASMRTLGTGALQAAAGNDSRLFDARTPTAHTHGVTDLTATGTKSTTTFLRGDNTWATPPGGTVTASQITDSTAVGRSVLTAADATAARSIIGAGTSSLALGTTSTTAASGNHTHTATDVGAIPAFADPNADRLVFWDDSAGSFQPLTLGLGLTISGATITADAQSPSLANMPAGTTITVLKSDSTWPARPTSRSDIIVAWKGADPSPSIVSSGTGGMLDSVDYRLVTP